MIYFQKTLNFRMKEPTVLTIGKFDGIHMGHKLILDEVLRQKKERGLRSAIFSFDTSPQGALSGSMLKQLTTNDERHAVLEKMGIDTFIECPFTQEVRNMEAEDFIAWMSSRMNVKSFVVGTDCRFGHNRSGSPEVLEKYAAKYGYDVKVIEKLRYRGRDISSTYIREEVTRGNMEKANMLLGYPFFVQGQVLNGNHLGNSFGFPTVNLIPQDYKLLPPYGVYAAYVTVGEDTYGGVANIGVKPTIQGDHVCGVETNIFDFSRDIYGEQITVSLWHFMRPEKKFASIDALKAQIRSDTLTAKELLEDVRITPLDGTQTGLSGGIA